MRGFESPPPVAMIEIRSDWPQAVLSLLKQLLNIPDDKSGTDDGSIRLVLEGNKLYVTGNKPDAPMRVQELLKTVEGGNSISDSLQLKVYTVKEADPDGALGDHDDARRNPRRCASKDPKTSSLIVLARPKDHLAVRNVLEQLDGTAARTRFSNCKPWIRRLRFPQSTNCSPKKNWGADPPQSKRRSSQ